MSIAVMAGRKHCKSTLQSLTNGFMMPEPKNSFVNFTTFCQPLVLFQVNRTLFLILYLLCTYFIEQLIFDDPRRSIMCITYIDNENNKFRNYTYVE